MNPTPQLDACVKLNAPLDIYPNNSRKQLYRTFPIVDGSQSSLIFLTYSEGSRFDFSVTFCS